MMVADGEELVPDTPLTAHTASVTRRKPTMARNAGIAASDLGHCERCESVNVRQIRTGRRPSPIRIEGHKAPLVFLRLYLDRCDDCGFVVMSGKARIGPFPKAYLPRTEPGLEAAAAFQRHDGDAEVRGYGSTAIAPQIATERKIAQAVNVFETGTKS